MNRILLFLALLVGVQAWGQDTTYFSDWELNNKIYQEVIQRFPSVDFLDYSSSIDRGYIKKFRIDSLGKDTIQARDWITVYNAFQTKNRLINLEDSTFTFTKKLYGDWMSKSLDNEVLTLPIGVIYQEGLIIKDEKYNSPSLFFSQSESDYGWNTSLEESLESLSETNMYFISSILFDEILFDQEIYLTFDTNYTVLSTKTIHHLSLDIQNQHYVLYPNDSVKIQLLNTTNYIRIGVYFTDSSYLENTQFFSTDTSYFETIEKSSPFTGGSHTFEPTSLDLDWSILQTILTDPEGANFRYKLRYGIIWGACNNTGKLNKPVFMLHGFRPNVLPVFPSLEKLYKTKFNFKGSQHGDDGIVDLLVKNGYDVVICRIDPGYMSIRIGARMLSDFFETVVEPQKLDNGSKFENIVLGFSMGGHYWRNMLMYDEHEHLNLSKNRHHHTRMWIPVDTPLEGANNPLAHQFAAKSVAEHVAGFPVFNIAYINMTSSGSQEQQRYDVNGVNGYDGASHRFHPYRINYLNEMSNTFYLGAELTKYRGYPSGTRNIAISVGSNSFDYYSVSPNNVPVYTYDQNSSFPTLLGIKHWDIKLRRAYHISSTTAAFNNPVEVFRRKITRTGFFGTNVLVNDKYETYDWYQLDNGFGSYLNAIKDNVNTALNWNSLLGFGANVYKKNQVFVPVLSSLGINPRFWPKDMKYDLKSNNLMFNSFNIDPQTGISNHFGYPHLGRPFDYRELTPMDAYYCNENYYEHITLIDDEENQNDQSELIDFLLNEIEPWYLDIQNQDLGEYARSNYLYQAKYQARNMIRTGATLSPKTPFGDYRVLSNVDLELQAGETIELKPGTHIQAGAKAHFYIQPLCYGSTSGLAQDNKPELNQNSNVAWDDAFANIPLENVIKPLLSVFPNPNEGMFTLLVHEEAFLEGELEVFSVFGQKMMHQKIIQENKLDFMNLGKGVYILRVKTNTKTIGQAKIIIK